jgi:hypothetical protein
MRISVIHWMEDSEDERVDLILPTFEESSLSSSAVM